MELFDIGANLTHESFASDIDKLLESACAVQVRAISITTSTLEDSRKAISLIEQLTTNIHLTTTVGFHPHYASSYSRSLYQEMLEQSQHYLVRAIGETGLDYYRNHSSPQDQKNSFAEHIQLAADTQLPIFLHQRDAHKPFVEMLTSHRDSLTKAVVHCFTGDKAMLHQYLDLDCYIGITGWICDPGRGSHLWPLVSDIPSDRLMVETDCPYLLPPACKQTLRRRNEPKCLPFVVQSIAEHRQESVKQLAQLTTANARMFFGYEMQEDR